MDSEKLQLLKDAAHEVKAQDIQVELADFEKRINDPHYYVVVVGQYSAGKSNLLNNILGRKLLPQGLRETTPLLTFLSYGEEEGANIYYEDGSVKEIDISEVAQVMQYGNEKYQLVKAERMEITLNSPLLANGMVLLDTPGNNTLIRRHEALLAKALSVASEVIYVSGKIPGKVDTTKLQELEEQGLPLSFVMTHCDEIREEEENFNETIAEVVNILSDEKIGIPEEKCWFVSNLPNSEYFARLEPLKQTLEDLGIAAKENWNVDMDYQAESYSKRLMQRLLEVQKVLTEQSKTKYNEQVLQEKKITSDISRLQERLEKLQRKLQNTIAKNCAEITSQSQFFVQETLRKASRNIEATDFSTTINKEEAMKDLLEREKKQVVAKLVAKIYQFADPMVQEINTDMPPTEYGLTFDDVPAVNSYNAMSAEQDEELQIYKERLNGLRENHDAVLAGLEEAKKDASQEMTQQIEEVEKNLKDFLAQDRDLGPYQPRTYVEEGKPGGSIIGETIGEVLDIAMLFIPATAITKLGKAANLTTKSTKILKSVAKANKGVTQIRTVTKALNKGNSTGERKKKANLLDYLSISEWGRKLGGLFDTPPRLVVDKEYEASYYAEKKRITDAIRQKQMQLYELKLQRHQYETEQARNKAKARALEVNAQEINTRLQQRERELKKESRERAEKNWQHACAQNFVQVMEKACTQIIENYVQQIQKKVPLYLEQRGARIKTLLNKKKQTLTDLRNLPQNEVVAKLSRINQLLAKLSA